MFLSKRYEALSIAGKISTVSILLTVFIALAISIPITYFTQQKNTDHIDQLRNYLSENYDNSIREETETALSMVNAIYEMYSEDSISFDEAKLLAANLIRKLNYGEGTYFWVDTREGVNVVLLGSDAEGKNRYNALDEKGNAFIKAIINTAINGGGYTEYWFAKKGETKPLPKRSYSIYFEPFEWVIGTGNYIDDIETHINTLEEKQYHEMRIHIIVVSVITIVAIIIALIGSLMFGKRFSNPIRVLSAKTEALANGDLDLEIKIDRSDEIGTLQKTISLTINKLREVLSEAINSSHHVASAGSQISKTAEHLSHGASRQAASTEEISSSVEEMVASIESNAENTKITRSSSLDLESGMGQLKDTVKANLEAMQQIQSKTNIINSISVETNLLALNASVEAARAGDAGKGFSVVAAEVRKLSDVTKKAADDIETYSNTTLLAVEESWTKLEGLIPKLEDTVNRINEISATTEEQNAGSGQINSAVQDLVSVTSKNAAASEELASSSEEMTRQSEVLRETISFFRIEA